MPKLIVGSTVIDFPNTGRDAVWSEAVDQFAVAVTDQLAGLSSTYDISPRTQDINIGSNDIAATVDVEACIFSPTVLRAFNFNYSLYSQNGTSIYLAEYGNVIGTYNSNSLNWEIEHSFIGKRKTDGTPYYTFSLSGNQLQITCTGISGTVSGSKLNYSAKTILKD